MKIQIYKDKHKQQKVDYEAEKIFMGYCPTNTDCVVLTINVYPKGTKHNAFAPCSQYEFQQDRGQQDNIYLLNCISDDNYLQLNRYREYEVWESSTHINIKEM